MINISDMETILDIFKFKSKYSGEPLTEEEKEQKHRVNS